MKIYSSQSLAMNLDELREFDCGVMLTPAYSVKPSKKFKEFNIALDNAVFPCFKKGYPFLEQLFFIFIERCYEANLVLDFIVAPDIIAGGLSSLDFSLEYVNGKLKTAPRLALAVQDGVTPDILHNRDISNFRNITHIFVGGTKKWKMETVREWSDFGHEIGLKVHVGQIGTVDRLIQCHEAGVDSVDSQNFSRNNTWNHLKEYREKYEGDQICF